MAKKAEKKEERRRLIPEISEEKLQQLSEHIKPVVRFAKGAEGLFQADKGYPYYIKPVDLRNTAFT